MGNSLSFFSFFYMILSSDVLLVILWLLGIYNFHKFENSSNTACQKSKAKVKAGKERHYGEKKGEENELKSPTISVNQLENYICLLEDWLYEQDNIKDDSSSVEEHLLELQNGSIVLNKIQIMVESVKSNEFHGLSLDVGGKNEAQRIQHLSERFKHIKAHIYLRQYMLKDYLRHFEMWLEEVKALKVWISEAMALHEKLHSMACESKSVIRNHLKLQEILFTESEFMKKKLYTCEKILYKLITTLKELGSWSKKFQQRVLKSHSNESNGWNDILSDSLIEEMVQVAERFSSVTKLNRCYSTHLNDLMKMTLPYTYSKPVNDLETHFTTMHS